MLITGVLVLRALYHVVGWILVTMCVNIALRTLGPCVGTYLFDCVHVQQCVNAATFRHGRVTDQQQFHVGPLLTCFEFTLVDYSPCWGSCSFNILGGQARMMAKSRTDTPLSSFYFHNLQKWWQIMCLHTAQPPTSLSQWEILQALTKAIWKGKEYIWWLTSLMVMLILGDKQNIGTAMACLLFSSFSLSFHVMTVIKKTFVPLDAVGEIH